MTTWCTFGQWHLAQSIKPSMLLVNTREQSRWFLNLARCLQFHQWSSICGFILPFCPFLFFCTFKALAWCPWQPNILASGGGTSDRHIRIWNANSGSCISALDTCSQVGFLTFGSCVIVHVTSVIWRLNDYFLSDIISCFCTKLQRVGVWSRFCSWQGYNLEIPLTH